jgi:hypothetical protein
MMAHLAPLRRGAWLAAVAAACVLWALDARAFHSGGVAECDGCHTIHNADGENQGGQAAAYLLRGSDASSRCLACHGGVLQAADSVFTTAPIPGTPPVNYTPGGDFAWVQRSYSWISPSGVQTSPGERHGHNVVASDFGLTGDTTRTLSPGGWYPADKLSCTSCHDPHAKYRLTASGGTFATTGAEISASGSYGDAGFRAPTSTGAVGAYRLLAGEGYAPMSTTGVPPFAWAPPVALAPTVYNQGESANEVRVAYGAGMSEWCGNCHGALHTPYAMTPSDLLHPSGSTAKLNASPVESTYNLYVKDGDLSGTSSSSYTSIVPYEEGTTDRLVLSAHARSDGTARIGPGTGMENVMCLSCHRAHASGWDYALRWNAQSDFIVVSGQWPGTDAAGDPGNPLYAQGRTQAETRGAMYDRDPTIYAPFQKSLCNKCHAK